jgi:hypothetical protein
MTSGILEDARAARSSQSHGAGTRQTSPASGHLGPASRSTRWAWPSAEVPWRATTVASAHAAPSPSSASGHIESALGPAQRCGSRPSGKEIATRTRRSTIVTPPLCGGGRPCVRGEGPLDWGRPALVVAAGTAQAAGVGALARRTDHDRADPAPRSPLRHRGQPRPHTGESLPRPGPGRSLLAYGVRDGSLCGRPGGAAAWDAGRWAAVLGAGRRHRPGMSAGLG